MHKQIQEKLIKFATRVPIFMYQTDYREMSLKDVITQLEPGLFKKVTGLDVKNFELLCSLGVFNANLMNQAIFSFKRYEDSSLVYTGIDRHEGKDVGGWDTVIKRSEYEKMFSNQQATMNVTDTIQEPEKEVITVKTESKQPVTYKSPVTTTPLAKKNAYRSIWSCFAAWHFTNYAGQDLACICVTGQVSGEICYAEDFRGHGCSSWQVW